jgi:hypothetical protein
MPDAQNHRSSERVRLDLIEADVDMAFGLVDDARGSAKATRFMPSVPSWMLEERSPT